MLVDSSGTWTQISAGDENACGIKDDALYCWGDREFGQVGDGVIDSINAITTPTLIDNTGVWSDVTNGEEHTCGIYENQLKCWGHDEFGQVGLKVPLDYPFKLVEF
ncbi:MAG: RCC1 domain-containing protein [Bdellovibrionales bacterium]